MIPRGCPPPNPDFIPRPLSHGCRTAPADLAPQEEDPTCGLTVGCGTGVDAPPPPPFELSRDQVREAAKGLDVVMLAVPVLEGCNLDFGVLFCAFDPAHGEELQLEALSIPPLCAAASPPPDILSPPLIPTSPKPSKKASPFRYYYFMRSNEIL